MNITNIIILALSTIVGSFGAYFFKRGADKLEINILKIITNWSLYIGAFLYLISNILFIIPLKTNNLFIVYGFSGLYYIWTMIIGKYLLEEKITVRKILAVALIIIGIIIINI